jgi:hypothetical protein
MISIYSSQIVQADCTKVVREGQTVEGEVISKSGQRWKSNK